MISKTNPEWVTKFLWESKYPDLDWTHTTLITFYNVVVYRFTSARQAFEFSYGNQLVLLKVSNFKLPKNPRTHSCLIMNDLDNITPPLTHLASYIQAAWIQVTKDRLKCFVRKLIEIIWGTRHLFSFWLLTQKSITIWYISEWSLLSF